MVLDQELVESLRRSKGIVGYLSPIVRDQDGNIISGGHRYKVDAAWPSITIEVRDELDREIRILHYNVQRKPSEDETKHRLIRIAKLLEEKGVEKERICSELSKLVPYSQRYVQELLSYEYKMRSKARRNGELGRQNKVFIPSPEDWNLEYYTVPLEPAEYQLVKVAVSAAKKELKLEDDGEALFMICKQYLEGKER